MGYVGKTGYDVASEEGIVVALDTELTPALEQEGLSRELIRALQDLRKEAGYDVSDRITVSVQATGTVAEAVKAFQDLIAKEVLATTFQLTPLPDADLTKTLTLEKNEVTLALKR